MDNTLKAISKDENALRVANYIVLFGGRDLEGLGSPRVNADGTRGEFFSPDVELKSNYTDNGQLYVDWEHGRDPEGTGMDADEVLGYVDWKTARKDDKGWFVERVLNRRSKYVKWLEELIEAGLIGNSTEPVQKGVEKLDGGAIVRWPLKRDTLTVQPMEPRMITENIVVAMKALHIDLPETEAGMTDNAKGGIVSESQQEKINMENEDFKAMLEDNNKSLVEVVKAEAATAAKSAVEDALKALPEVQKGVNLEVTVDEADRPFKSVAEQMLAQKDYAMSGKVDPRLRRINYLTQAAETGKSVKALLGSNETIPSQGEFLLEPTISAEFLKPIHEEGPISRFAKRMPVASNSVSGWINGVDETNRTAGNRWGGVRAYWLNEGESMTASQPKFKRINWELHPLAVLQYATDYMLRDSALMDSVIRETSLQELNFVVNDAMFRGTGAGQPKGLGTAGNAALISATRTNATNIDHDDILRMKQRMSPSGLARAIWLANPDTMGELDSLTFTSGSTGILSPYVRYAEDGVMFLAGRPVVFNEFSPTLGSLGDLILWDPQDYLYWEGAGVEGASSIHVQFLTNQTVFRFLYRCDGMPASYSAITPAQGSVTVSPYIGLAAST